MKKNFTLLFMMWLGLSMHVDFAFGQVKVFELPEEIYVTFAAGIPVDTPELILTIQTVLGEPIGGYVANNDQLNDWVEPTFVGGDFSIDNGIFGVDTTGKPYLLKYRNAYDVSFAWAIQGAPILVYNGQNTRNGKNLCCDSIDNNSRFQRSGIGFRVDGSVVVIVSLSPLNIWDFAQLFLENGCSNAINLNSAFNVGYVDKCGSDGSLDINQKRMFFWKK